MGSGFQIFGLVCTFHWSEFIFADLLLEVIECFQESHLGLVGIRGWQEQQLSNYIRLS